MTNRSKLDSLIKAATAVIVAEDRKMIARLDTSSVKFSDEFDAKIKAYILKMKRKGATVARMHKAFWVAACIIAFLPVVFFTLLRPGTSPVAPPDTEETEPIETYITTHTAEVDMYNTVKGRFFIAAYHNETGKIYAVESEPSTTWSPEWPGNWVAGFAHLEHEGTFWMAVTQKPEGPGVFDMFPTTNGEFASVVGFEAPVDGKYSPEIKLERAGSDRDAYVRLMKNNGTILQEITGPKRGEPFTLSATNIELKAKEQLWVVVDRAPGEEDLGGYNVSFISFTVIGPEANVPGVEAPEVFTPETGAPPVTEPPVTAPPVTSAPETEAPETEAPPYDDIDSPLYESKNNNYPGILNDPYIILSATGNQNVSDEDLRDAAYASRDGLYGEQLPYLYVGLKWYIAKHESITKEEFWEAVKDTGLTEEQVDVMFTFDDDLVMHKLHNKRSFYFKGKLYSADYMSGISNRGTDQIDHSETLIGAMKRSSELGKYISDVLKIDKKLGEQLKAYFDGLQVGQPMSLGDYLVSHLEVGSPDAYESVFSYIAKAHGYTETEIEYLHYRFTGNIDDPHVESEAHPDRDSPKIHQYLIWYNSAVHKVTKEEFKAACEKFNSNVLYDWERITDVQIDAMFAAIDKRNDPKVIESFYSPLALKHEGTFRRLEAFAVLCKQNAIAAQYKGNEDIKRCLEIAKNYTFNEKTEYIEILKSVYAVGTSVNASKTVANAASLAAEGKSDDAKALLDTVKDIITYESNTVKDFADNGDHINASLFAEYLTANAQSDEVIEDAISLASGGDHSTAFALISSVSDRFTADGLMDKAKALIDEKRFDAAYVILSVIDTDEAKELMKEFTLLKVTDSDSTYHYINSYDESGRLVKVQRKQTNIPGTDFEYEVSIIYTYNSLGQLINEYNNVDGEVNYEFIYDSKGRRVKMYYTSKYDGNSEFVYEYDDNDRIIKSTKRYLNLAGLDSTITELEYNSASLVTRITSTTRFVPGDTWDDNFFTDYRIRLIVEEKEYDSDGNLLKESTTTQDFITDSNWNIEKPEDEAYTYSSSYEYDENGRLVYSDGTVYEYDENGNLLYEKLGSTLERSYSYNELGQLVLETIHHDKGNNSISFYYDCFGNLTKEITHYYHDTNPSLNEFTYSYIIAE